MGNFDSPTTKAKTALEQAAAFNKKVMNPGTVAPKAPTATPAPAASAFNPMDQYKAKPPTDFATTPVPKTSVATTPVPGATTTPWATTTPGVSRNLNQTPEPVAPATPSVPSVPAYTGMSNDDYKNNLLNAVKAGIMTEYEANASIIKNNLAKAMSDMDSELAALEPLYQNQLQTIADNQFATSQSTKEVMNQSGWNTSNSGLAMGEQTKISMAADKSRADSALAKTQSQAEITRKKTLQQQLSDNELATAEKIKNEKLSGAEAEALIQADTRNRQIYESDRTSNQQQQQFSESIRQFNEQMKETKANRTASEKAQAAQLEATTSQSEKDEIYSESMASLYSAKSQQEIMDILRSIIAPAKNPDGTMPPAIPASVAEKLQASAATLIKMIQQDGSVMNPNSSILN